MELFFRFGGALYLAKAEIIHRTPPRRCFRRGGALATQIGASPCDRRWYPTLDNAVLVDPVRNRVQVLLIDLGDGADHGAVAHVPADGEGPHFEALADDFL